MGYHITIVNWVSIEQSIAKMLFIRVSSSGKKHTGVGEKTK